MQLFRSLSPILNLILLVSTPIHASVTCVSVGSAATATWVNAAAETCSFAAIVGSNFGLSPADVTIAAEYEFYFLSFFVVRILKQAGY